MDEQSKELIRKLKTGNISAFDTIFKKYYKLLCYEAKSYFRNHSLVEEIVCDVFTRIWNNRNEININIALREYLIKSVHNNCINYYRIQKTQEKLKKDVDENLKKSFALIDLGLNPLEFTISNELEEQLVAAVESLPKQYKQAFKLSRINDLSYEEIAGEMGISVNSVKLYIKKALVHLRKKLVEYLVSAIIVLLFY